MECQYCGKHLSNKGALTLHEKSCLLNENRVKRVFNRTLPLIPWNKGLTKNTDERVKQNGVAVSKIYETKDGTFKGKKHTPEVKNKISNSMKGNRNANHRGDRQSFYNDIRMDSRWEAATAKYFDENKIVWIYSEYGFKLSDGRYYYPDFFVYENNTLKKLVEVKGYFRDANKQKFAMFQKEYPKVTIELWDKEVLQRLKII